MTTGNEIAENVGIGIVGIGFMGINRTRIPFFAQPVF